MAELSVALSGSFPSLSHLRVRPRKQTLTPYGCVWEYILMMKGFNELPESDKWGRILAAHSNGIISVAFDAIHYIATVFPSEVIIEGWKDGETNG